MQVIEQSYELLDDINGEQITKKLERCGRVCYKSEARITDVSADGFIKGIVKSGHESVIEHQSLTVAITTARSTTHQLVRHRIASYSQESQRYVKYDNVRFILPCGIEKHSTVYYVWLTYCKLAETGYKALRTLGCKAETARCLLPNCTATEIVVTANLREWRHIFKERAVNKYAQQDVRELMTGLLNEFKAKIPAVFSDLDT